MLTKLESVYEKYKDIEKRLTMPEVYSDAALMASLMKEQKTLSPVAEAYSSYRAYEQQAKEARELMSDPELRDMANEEFEEAKEAMSRLENEIRLLLLPRDPNDDKNVIIEIRGGAGGEEAALFCAALYRMYCMYAEAKRFKTETLYMNDTELGGIKEASFMVVGDGAYSRFKFESGVHRVQRVPDTEASGRIHTSTATVAVLPEAEDVDIEINPQDLDITTCRSGGAGGQHVNKTESAIRIVHIPSGIAVECQEERSQHKNRDKAMKLLKSRLLNIEREKQEAAIAGERKSQVGTGDRSERIRTYNFPQGRVTDHRINLTLYKINEIINGSLDELVNELIAADQAEKLKGGNDE